MCLLHCHRPHLSISNSNLIFNHHHATPFPPTALLSRNDYYELTMRFRTQLTNITTFTSTSPASVSVPPHASVGASRQDIYQPTSNHPPRTNRLPLLPGKSLLATSRRCRRPIHHHPRPGHPGLGPASSRTSLPPNAPHIHHPTNTPRTPSSKNLPTHSNPTRA
jgi:hypothetical protein